MKILAVQLLASIAVFSSISFSQKDKEGKGHTNYLLFDKTINVEEIIRIGERKSETVRENAEKKESNKSQLSSFLTKISNAYKMNNDMFQSKGLQWFNNTDNSTGTAFVCGKYLFLFFIMMHVFSLNIRQPFLNILICCQVLIFQDLYLIKLVYKRFLCLQLIVQIFKEF